MILNGDIVDVDGKVYAQTKGTYIFLPNPDPEKNREKV